jgi:hypothetical protein
LPVVSALLAKRQLAELRRARGAHAVSLAAAAELMPECWHVELG